MRIPRCAAGALLPAVLLCSCAPPVQHTEEQAAPLVWPEAPSPPRIAFVQAFSRPEELGIGKGFFQRVAEVIFGANDERIVRPMAVAAVGNTLYVADPWAHGVHRFDLANHEYALLHGPDDTPLVSPVGLARGAAGDVYVSDSALARVFVIKAGGKGATPVALDARLEQPTGIAFDAATGRLFVVDTAAHRVNVFDREGKLESVIGRRGAGNGEFNYPTLLWRATDERLYVTDSLNFRIQIFNARGEFERSFGRQGDGSGDLSRHKGVALDRYGHIYVVDSLFQAIQIFDGDGRLLLSVGGLGRNRGEFWLPTGIFIGDEDRIYVADSYNGRVQVFRYIGGPT